MTKACSFFLVGAYHFVSVSVWLIDQDYRLKYLVQQNNYREVLDISIVVTATILSPNTSAPEDVLLIDSADPLFSKWFARAIGLFDRYQERGGAG